ncbi:MAG: hypothetical protein H7Y27_12255 [Gemmatimonadaceae bacterium]|nr:hypothetical protein [Chitinophagaceae bacterium]
MFTKTSISTSSVKKAFASFLLIGLAAMTFASIGGGGNKSNEKTVVPDVRAIRTTNGFTLKTGPLYRGSMMFAQTRVNNTISFNSVVTYQKGNTTYILPSRYKMTTNCQPKSNLQVFNLKVGIK